MTKKVPESCGMCPWNMSNNSLSGYCMSVHHITRFFGYFEVFSTQWAPYGFVDMMPSNDTFMNVDSFLSAGL